MRSAVNREFLALCGVKHIKKGNAFTPRHQGAGAEGGIELDVGGDKGGPKGGAGVTSSKFQRLTLDRNALPEILRAHQAYLKRSKGGRRASFKLSTLVEKHALLVRVAVVDFWESRLRPRSSVASSMLSFVP